MGWSLPLPHRGRVPTVRPHRRRDGVRRLPLTERTSRGPGPTPARLWPRRPHKLIERDRVHILSGVRWGSTLGSRSRSASPPGTVKTGRRPWRRRSGGGRRAKRVSRGPARPCRSGRRDEVRPPHVRNVLSARAPARQRPVSPSPASPSVCSPSSGSHPQPRDRDRGVRIGDVDLSWDEVKRRAEASESAVPIRRGGGHHRCHRCRQGEGRTRSRCLRDVALGCPVGLGSYVQWDRRSTDDWPRRSARSRPSRAASSAWASRPRAARLRRPTEIVFDAAPRLQSPVQQRRGARRRGHQRPARGGASAMKPRVHAPHAASSRRPGHQGTVGRWSSGVTSVPYRGRHRGRSHDGDRAGRRVSREVRRRWTGGVRRNYRAYQESLRSW